MQILNKQKNKQNRDEYCERLDEIRQQGKHMDKIINVVITEYGLAEKSNESPVDESQGIAVSLFCSHVNWTRRLKDD